MDCISCRRPYKTRGTRDWRNISYTPCKDGFRRNARSHSQLLFPIFLKMPMNGGVEWWAFTLIGLAQKTYGRRWRRVCWKQAETSQQQSLKSQLTRIGVWLSSAVDARATRFVVLSSLCSTDLQAIQVSCRSCAFVHAFVSCCMCYQEVEAYLVCAKKRRKNVVKRLCRVECSRDQNNNSWREACQGGGDQRRRRVALRRMVRLMHTLPSSNIRWLCVVVVAEYAAICRDQCVSSASSCRSWRRGVPGRTDLSVALCKQAAEQTVQQQMQRPGDIYIFFYSVKKKISGHQSSTLVPIWGHQGYLRYEYN